MKMQRGIDIVNFTYTKGFLPWRTYWDYFEFNRDLTYFGVNFIGKENLKWNFLELYGISYVYSMQ